MSSCILLIFQISILFHPAFFDSYRLHDFVVPRHYDLEILANVEDDVIYTGKLEIVTKCLNATKKITLHRDRSIKLNKIELKEINEPVLYKVIREVPLEQILYSNKLDILTIFTQKNLTQNRFYLISMEFKGNFTDTPTGIYRGNFSSSSGTSFYAITFFQPMGARRAFPCFDEPEMTATFGLSIGRKEKFNSTSNMHRSFENRPVKNKTGWYWDSFMSSLPMSTYSFCFIIYDAGFTRIGREEDLIRIIARKEMVASLEMVTRTAPKLMAFFQAYFQRSFILPKVDLIALPAVGKEVSIATPGLIIIQEKSLFYEPFTMKQDEVQDILLYLSQKIAYQWICTVKVKWWSDLWTTVSLANFYARDALANLSESQSTEREVPDALLQYFHQEGGLPFVEEVNGDVESVTTALSYIDYEKSGLLMRMARHLTDDTEVKELAASFLKKNSYQKVNQEEFWKIFEYSSKSLYNAEAPLNDVIKGWSNQSGIPVIQVRRNYKSDTAMVIQKANVEQISCRWIPISYASKSEGKTMDKNVRLWLKSPNDTMTIKLLPSSDWLLLNLDVYFPYRINYDVRNWNLLHSTLKDPSLYETIPPLNRMQLVDDLFEFTLGNNLNITFEFFLDFMEFLRFDQSYSTWTAFSKNMYRLHWRLQSSKEAVNLLDSYMQNLLRRHFRAGKICMKENSLLNVSFSTVITEAACFFKLPVCLREVKGYYKKYRMSKNPFNEDSPFSTDLRGVIFCYAIKHGEVDDFNFLLKAYISSKNIFERRDMLQGLYCTQDTSLLKGIPAGRRVARNVQEFEDQISKMIKIRETAENLADSESSVSSSLTTTTEIDSSTYRNAPKEDINLNSSSHTSLESDVSTEISTNSSSTSLSTNSSSTVGTNGTIITSTPGNLGNISDNSSSPGAAPSSNASQGLENTGQLKLNLNSRDLENIILRSKMDVASDIFYQKIVTISLSEALRHIWLFTERINEKKDLDNFKKFFNQNKMFVGIEQHIKNRIKHVEYNLKWQENKTEEMVEAFRKHLGVKEELRSDAFTFSVTGKSFIILGSLSISFFHECLIK